MIARVAAVASALLLGAVVLFQVALVLGAPWGEYTQGGGTAGSLPVAGRVTAVVSMVPMPMITVARAGD